MPAFHVRSYEASDLGACVWISNAANPAHPLDLDEARSRDEAWDGERYVRVRYVAVDGDGGVVGWGHVAHHPWQFHPRKFTLRLEVTPRSRRQGAGSALFARLLAEARARDALALRAVATEGDAESIGFLTRRGFREIWRNLESRLSVQAFDPAPFVGVEERVARQGVTITTLAQELARDRGVLREVYEMTGSGSTSGNEEMDTVTPPPFEEYVANEVEAPRVLKDAWFLARLDSKLIGASTLDRLTGTPDALEVGYTAVVPEYRRRGIATALKLRTIAYAREHGYCFIQTDSNANNEPMLRLNAQLGFEPQPARITYALDLG